uniref:Uncharacterized protein n=1 Tax=Anguilla anguilla TaxID=7936 RepID=A0A0E9SVR6_ANGAN
MNGIHFASQQFYLLIFLNKENWGGCSKFNSRQRLSVSPLCMTKILFS